MANAQTPPRQFFTGPPRILIYDSTTLKFQLRWSNADNLDTKDTKATFWWDRHSAAATTEVDSGRLYDHYDGFRQHGLVNYNVYDGWSLVDPRSPDRATQMTEYEIWVIDDAQVAGWDILFVPHDDIQVDGNDARYRVEVLKNQFDRRANAQDRVKAVFECVSRNVLTRAQRETMRYL